MLMNLLMRPSPPPLRLPAAMLPAEDFESDFDPVSQAVAVGLEHGLGGLRPSHEELDRALRLTEDARLGIDVDHARSVLLDFVARYPGDPKLQIYALRILEAQQAPGIGRMWQSLHGRFPRSPSIARQNIRRALRVAGLEVARELIAEEFPQPPTESGRLLVYATLLEEIRDSRGADLALRRLLEDPSCTAGHRLTAATIHEQRGDLAAAAGIVAAALERFPNHEGLKAMSRRLARDINAIAEFLDGVPAANEPMAGALLRGLLERFSVGRSEHPERSGRFIGPIVFISGSLAVGGAERQLAATTLGLQTAIRTGTPVAGFDIVGPIDVVCRSLYSRAGGDFFLADLEKAGIRVEEYTHYPEYGGRVRRSAVAAIERALRHLPADTADATRRLVDVLRVRAPEIVHIWQDGMIVTCLLAALIAGVPRIVLTVRTLPPCDRPERYRPDYEVLYRAALRIPGVRIVANSKAVAARYAAWLGAPAHRIGVISNGLAPQNTHSDSATRQIAGGIRGSIEAGDFIVGTAMRFDENKRPLAWIDCAREILSREPNAHFIMAGDGPLLPAARELASRFGMTDRVHFIGRSRHIGFWLERLSVFVLLSRYESLPNALIEAQFAGLPVVATPAGGAGETFLPGETGTLLADAEQIDPVTVAQAVLHWKLSGEPRAAVSRLAKEHARAKFSVETMLTGTVLSYVDA
jgi:glycosyltransferase involved in cell wall biosynthesis